METGCYILQWNTVFHIIIILRYFICIYYRSETTRLRNSVFYLLTKQTLTDVGRNWLEVGSAPYIALKQIVCNKKKLLNDLNYFIKSKHRGNLESYHCLLNKYCPKRLYFTYKAMVE